MVWLGVFLLLLALAIEAQVSCVVDNMEGYIWCNSWYQAEYFRGRLWTVFFVGTWGNNVGFGSRSVSVLVVGGKELKSQIGPLTFDRPLALSVK